MTQTAFLLWAASLALSLCLVGTASAAPLGATCPTADEEPDAAEVVTKPSAWDGWIDLVPYTPSSEQPLNPVMTTLPVNQAAGQLPGRSVFALAANEQACLAADSVLHNWRGRAVLLSRLAYLTYFSESDARANGRRRQELADKWAASDALQEQTPLRSDIEKAGLERRLAKLDREDCKLALRRQLKEEHLVLSRFASRQDLVEEFSRAQGLTQERLDAMAFHAELYARDDEWVLAFRGTVGGLGGWATNLAQILSVVEMVDNGTEGNKGAAGQYEVADRLVKFLLRKGVPRERLYVTGHSLGGGLATYAHLANNLAGALVFNPAQLGVASRTLLARQKHYVSAQGRVANYMSQSRSEFNDADPVSQGTSTVSTLLAKVNINVPAWGSLHGSTFYIPVEEEPVPAAWRTTIFAAGATLGVAGTAPALAAIGAGAMVYQTQGDRGNKDVLAAQAAKTAGRATTILKVGSKVARAPLLSAAKAVGGGLALSSAVKGPMEFLWHEFLLHSMAPLATALVSNSINNVTVTCASDPDPAYAAAKAKRMQSVSAALAGLALGQNSEHPESGVIDHNKTRF